VLTQRVRWTESFSSLRVRNYRIFAITHLVSMSGTWMQRVTQDWLVLTLSHSVAAVGVTVAMQFTPMLLFGLHGGLVVDRYSKRMLLMITQSIIGALIAVLAALALTHSVQVWEVWTIAFLVGMVVVVDNPARQVFVSELVGPRNLRNAISLNASIFQLGGLIGPAAAGFLLDAVGAGWAFAINSATCFLAVLALVALDKSQLVKMPPAVRFKGQLKQGLDYVVKKPAILWSVVMAGILSTFALTLPVILTADAHDVFKVGATGYGLFNTLLAAGALTGALISTRRRGIRLRTVVMLAGIWSVVQALAALMPTEFGFGLGLVAIGLCNLLFGTGANALVQISSNVAVRGRVMSVYLLVMLGGQAVGGPMMGWIVSTYGPRYGMLISGLVPAIATTVICLYLARSRNLGLRVTFPPGIRIASTRTIPAAAPHTRTAPCEGPPRPNKSRTSESNP
jgi:MFS family permease